MEITEGKVFKVKYPFWRTMYDPFPEDPESNMVPDPIPCWKPGVRPLDYYYDGEVNSWGANGEGEMILNIISVHKPGKYPTRIFFTRQFCDPDGTVFGKTKLNIRAAGSFKKFLNWFGEEYKITDKDLNAK